MEWVIGLLGGVFSKAVTLYFWSKIAASAVMLGLVLAGLLLLLMLMWLITKQPKAGLIFTGILVVLSLYVEVKVQPKAPAKTIQNSPTSCPAPFMGATEVTSGWKSVGGWDRYWIDQHIPKEWKPYQGLIRVRIDTHDLYIVFTSGALHVLGEKLNVRAVEPLTGTLTGVTK